MTEPFLAFAALAKAIRKERRMSGLTLASRLNRNASYVYRVENGKAPPPPLRLVRAWAIQLNANLDDFERVANESIMAWPNRMYRTALAPNVIPINPAEPFRELGKLSEGGRRCPLCHMQTQVTDSRETSNGFIRRRRECPTCHARFTTYEISNLALEHIFAEQMHVIDRINGVLVEAHELIGQFKHNLSFSQLAFKDADQAKGDAA